MDNKQAHGALGGVQLCKDHERVAREHRNVRRFLGRVLIVSNPTFSANLERLHGVGSPLPRRVPPAIRCRSFPEIKWPLHFVYHGLQLLVWSWLCVLYILLWRAGLLASHTPLKASRMTRLLPNLAGLCFFLVIFTSLHPFPNHLCLRVIDRMFSSMFR